MLRPLISICVLIMLCLQAHTNLHAQGSTVIKHNARILRSAKIGKEYQFSNEDGSATSLKYLGTVQAKSGREYKVLTSVWIWGQAHRATSRILIYSSNNKYIGNYYVTIVDDLPTKILANQLVFSEKKGNCTFKVLMDALHSQIYNECGGDVYSFK